MESTQTRFTIQDQQNVSDSCSINNGYLLGRLSYMTSQIQFMKRSLEQKQTKSKETKSHKEVRFQLQNSMMDSFNETVRGDMDLSHLQNLKESKKILLKSRKRERKKKNLQNVVHNLKVQNLLKNFMKKLSLNNIKRTPVQFEPFSEKNSNNSTSQYNGLEIPGKALTLFFFLSIVYTLLSLFLGTLSVVFKKVLYSQEVKIFHGYGIVWMLLEIIFGFTRVYYDNNYEKLEKLRSITLNYLKKRFWIDIACLISLIIDISVESDFDIYLRLIFFLRLPDCLEKMQKMQTKIFNTSHKEHYWGLVKILLLNFIFAHLLAIILIVVTWINTQDNWLKKVNALQSAWYEQYSWAYYWGTTIMLTVGFGDISAVNYKQAICLTFIQALSCITLAYNINCVGNLISNIRSEGLEKEKRQKTLKHLGEKNNISENLTSKISNFIEKSSKIKKKFNIEEDAGFVASLPNTLKQSFLRESNKKIFDNIPFFKHLTEQTLLNLAEKIQMWITHPDEIIEKVNPNIMILKQGQISFCSKMRGSRFNSTVIEKIKVEQEGSPLLLSFEFIVPLRTKNFEMRSKKYSILYTMQVHSFIEILKGKQKDIEQYFYLKDKSKHIVDEFEFKDCEYCDSKHLKFRCSRLHYLPITQHIILKHISKIKMAKNQRMKLIRPKKSTKTFQYFYKYKKEPVINSDQSISISEDNEYQSQSQPLISLIEKLLANNKEVDISSIKRSLLRKRSDSKMIQEVASKVKNEIMQYINEQYNWFWQIQCDCLKDYQFYFSNANSKNLAESYPGKILKNKKKKKSERSINV